MCFASRADYGLLRPIIKKKIKYDKKLVLKLLISELIQKSLKYNIEITKDNIQFNTCKFPKLFVELRYTQNKLFKKIDQYFKQVKPKVILVLGDRVETFFNSRFSIY